MHFNEWLLTKLSVASDRINYLHTDYEIISFSSHQTAFHSQKIDKSVISKGFFLNLIVSSNKTCDNGNIEKCSNENNEFLEFSRRIQKWFLYLSTLLS